MNKTFANNENENNASWILWCRLCAKDEPQSNQKTILNDEINENTNTNLYYCIEKYLSINVTRDDTLPKMICGDCHTSLSAWANFAERALKVQTMFADMQSSKNCNQTQEIIMRSKYGLLNEETDIEIISDIRFFNENYERNDVEKSSTIIAIIADPLEDESMEIKTETKIVKEASTYDDKLSSLNDESDTKIQINKTKNIKRRHTMERKILKNRKTQVNSIKSIKSNNDDIVESDEKEKEENYFYACVECPRRFKQINYYRKHMRVIHGKDLQTPIYKCPKCLKDLKCLDKLKKHMRTHIPIEVRNVLPCPDCGKKFAFKSGLQLHIKGVHKDERPFVCEKCGIGMRSAAGLNEHMVRHTDDTPFECEICKRCFKSALRLKIHNQMHDTTDYICSECGQQLSSRITLNRHLVVHSNMNNHKCDYCGRAFKRSQALKNHLILHTGLKPYSCDFCDRTFANGSNCRSHKKKVHPEELAALEATGKSKIYTPNIPRLDTLRAVTKNADASLAPVVSKQSGNFIYSKKSKQLSTDSI